MFPTLARRYDAFRQSVFASVRDDDALLPGLETLPAEIELQSRWFAGSFGDTFTTLDGRQVTIRDFGHWNHAAGPDFTDVAIELGGNGGARSEVLSGSIELDTDLRDWEHHGHSTNRDYDDVVLHLYFTASEKLTVYTRTSQHREVPQVRLDLAMLEGAGPAPRELAEARLGRCSHPLAEMDVERVNELLAAAAQHRLEAKYARLSRTLRHHGHDQSVYEAIAEAFGYRGNQVPLRILAQRLPLKLLRQQPDNREALLFGLAGFLAENLYDEAPVESRPYLRELWETWWKERESHAARTPLDWRLAGIRPGNHPQRRLGGLLAVVENWPALGDLLAAPDKFKTSDFIEFFAGLEHPYWSHHYTLASAAAKKPIRLVGETRAVELLANLAFPLLVPLHPPLWEEYLKVRARLQNQKTRRATLRLFGTRSDAAQFQKRLHQQQGLLQIFDDFCLSDDSGCEDCTFPERLVEWC